MSKESIGIHNITTATGEPMEGLSIEHMLEIMDSLKRYDAERVPLINLAVSRDEPTINNLPAASEPEPYTLFGFPVYMSDAIPPGYGMGQTSCGCPWGDVERDGGALMHMAKRHTVILKFDSE